MALFVSMMYILISLPILIGRLIHDRVGLKRINAAAQEMTERRSAFRKKFTDYRKVQLLERDMFGNRRETVEKLKQIFDRFEQLKGLEIHYADYPENYRIIGVLLAAADGFLYRDTICPFGSIAIRTPDGLRCPVSFTQQTIDQLCGYITQQYRGRGANISFGVLPESARASIKTYGFY